MPNYILIVKDKLIKEKNIYYGSLQKLQYKGMDFAAMDRKNITAKVYEYKHGKIGLLACDCNLLLECYEE